MPMPKWLLLSRQELALVLITIFWGATFLVVQKALSYSGPLFFVGMRFAAAAIAVGLLSHRVLRGLTLAEVKAGFLIGTTIFAGYTLQTIGLQTIPSSKSAFLTALYVPFVPLLQWLLFRKMPHIMSWLGIALAFTGLILLTGPVAGAFDIGKGELLTTLGAVAIACEILLISRYAGKVDLRRVTVVQLAATALLAFAFMPIAGERIAPFSWALTGFVLLMGLASAVIQFTMNWAQKTVSPTRATIIYAGEPVWGGVVGRLAGERLPALALLGAAFIVAGVLVSELRPRFRRTPPSRKARH